MNSVQAKIFSTQKMQEVASQVNEALKRHNPVEVLVTFDIDMTLTFFNHPAIFYGSQQAHKSIFKAILSTLTTEERDLFNSFLIHTTLQIVVEPETATLIKKLQAKHIKTIAFTAALTGLIPPCTRMEEKRFENLNELGINFEDSFKEGEIVFKEIPAYHGHHPVFYRGILYSNGEQGTHGKGATLIEFLKRVNYHPKIVILVDDRRKNLEDVDKHLHDFDPTISFIGLEYEGTHAHLNQVSSAEFQEFVQSLADMAKMGY